MVCSDVGHIRNRYLPVHRASKMVTCITCSSDRNHSARSDSSIAFCGRDGLWLTKFVGSGLGFLAEARDLDVWFLLEEEAFDIHPRVPGPAAKSGSTPSGRSRDADYCAHRHLRRGFGASRRIPIDHGYRSEEHTSELQSLR